jgi:hypothetical protein
MTDSHVTVSASGTTSYVGPDATRLFQALAVRQGLKACKIGLRVSRAATPTRLFALTKSFTGKAYKRGDYDGAIADLTVWIDAMNAAMPVVEQ